MRDALFVLLIATAVLGAPSPEPSPALASSPALAPSAQASAAPAAKLTVMLAPGGQYYHRAGHLVIEEPQEVALDAALGNGYTPCPECTPPSRDTAGALIDPGEGPVLAKLRADQAAGRSYEGVRTPVTIQPLSPTAGPANPGKQKAPAGNPVQRTVLPADGLPADGLPADGIPVPGTGGLLKVPTFKGSGGIIAVPLQYGGYTVVQPTFSGSPAPPAADPAPSGR